MYLSQSKFHTTKLETSFSNKQNILPPFKQPVLTPNKFTLFPPKIHRVSSSSVLNLDQPIFNSSLSKDFKGYRDFSKTKPEPSQPKTNMSFNATYDLPILNNDFNIHRHSCNLDIDRNSDNAKSTSNFVNSLDGKHFNADLEKRVKQLEERIKKNQESLKFYNEEIEHFKHQFSSTSNSHLLDSTNTNVLTVSTREPLKDVSSNALSLNSVNKENFSKNITSIDSLTNSPKESEMQKKLKQIDDLKKDVKKIMGRQETIKSDMKLFQASIKDILTGFREYLSQSVEGLSKMQEKSKKKIFEKVTQEIEKKFKNLTENHFEPLKKMVQNFKVPEMETKATVNLTKSSQKYLKDPIMLKVRQQSFCMVKKSSKVSPFESYQDMIKRELYQAMGRPIQPSNQNYPRMSEEIQTPNNAFENITLDETQVTYFIDEDGYLLDHEGYYLMKDGERIQLDSVQIQKLKENKVLKTLNTYY